LVAGFDPHFAKSSAEFVLPRCATDHKLDIQCAVAPKKVAVGEALRIDHWRAPL
jgi:hypothetical protein